MTEPSAAATSPTRPTSSSAPSHQNTGAIAGGVVGGVVVLALIAGLLFLLLRRLRRRRSDTSVEKKGDQEATHELYHDVERWKRDTAELHGSEVGELEGGNRNNAEPVEM